VTTCSFNSRGQCVVCGHPRFALVQICDPSAKSEPQPNPATPTGGPGTELSRLLKKFGIEPTPTCSCRAKAAEMDSWGPDECERPERIDEVVAVMRSEAAARGLPFLDAAGKLLVRRAIANARREEARHAQEKARSSPPAV
jgi:hypothetical protein